MFWALNEERENCNTSKTCRRKKGYGKAAGHLHDEPVGGNGGKSSSYLKVQKRSFIEKYEIHGASYMRNESPLGE